MWEGLFVAYAKLVVLAFEKLEPEEIEELCDTLDLKGKFIEASLRSDMMDSLHSHDILTKRILDGEDATLLELMLILHDIEFWP